MHRAQRLAVLLAFLTPIIVAAPAKADDSPVDHFMFYKVKTAKKTPKFVKFGPVTLSDEFGSADYVIDKPTQLGPPANKNGEGVGDPSTHLMEYQVKLVKGAPKFSKRSDVRIMNQCNDLFVEAKKPVSLLVPTAKDLAAPVPPPDPAGHTVDHFLCYQAKALTKLSDGTKLPGLPKGTQVDVEDQFQTRRYDLKKVTKLCNPVAKSGDPVLLSGPDKGVAKPIEPATIENPGHYLLCYQAKLAKNAIPQNGCGAIDPKDKGTKIVPEPMKHQARLGVHIANQFGSAQLDTKKEVELCIPSEQPFIESKVVFAVFPDLRTADINKNDIETVALGAGSVFYADAEWSPGGDRIAYSQFDYSGNGPRNTVWTMNADGSDKQLVSDPDEFATDPSWSPDGSKIVHVTGAGLVVSNSDGSGRNLIPEPLNRSFGSPTWSPDGSKIAVSYRDSSTLPSTNVIAVVSPSGGSVSEITNGPFDGDPFWSPDSTRIAYSALDELGDPSQVRIVGAGGGGHSAVTPSSRDMTPVDWAANDVLWVHESIPRGSTHDHQILTVNPDGSDLTLWSGTSEGVQQIDWHSGS